MVRRANRRRILVIEDEPDIARGLRDALEFEQFEVTTAGLGREGIKSLRERGADLVILDLMLPDINGFTVCEEMRQSHPVVPIIMLTARSQETDKIRGLEAGADDYVTKPFSVGELVARINAIFPRLHRSSGTDEAIQIGQATVYPRRHELVRNRKTVPLSFYEVEILAPAPRTRRRARAARRDSGKDLGRFGLRQQPLGGQFRGQAAQEDRRGRFKSTPHRDDIRNWIQTSALVPGLAWRMSILAGPGRFISR
jgi:DNA-binding response OmpR family regulator